MRKAIYFTAILFISVQISLIAGNPNTQTPKLNSPAKSKKGNASYSVNKENRKSKKLDKTVSLNKTSNSEMSQVLAPAKNVADNTTLL